MLVPARVGTRVPLRAPRLRWFQDVKLKTAMVVVQMAYSRQWVADSLRRMGYPQAADEALQDLPEEVDRQQVEEFCQRYGISRDEMVSRMGGSP
jgi:hypothetical protein